MRKSRLAGMTEAELDELAFEIDECQTAKGKPLSMTRWRTRIGNRVKEVQEESGLGERPERYSPAWLYMLYAREALAEADLHDADELPFRLYEIYGDRFQQTFNGKVEQAKDTQPQPPTTETDTEPIAEATATQEEPPMESEHDDEAEADSDVSDEPAISEVDWNAF